MSCDVLVALGPWTRDGSTLFAKNSDRAINECQQVRHAPRATHGEALVKCTYVELPQAPETYEAILFCPHWTWGAEMGVNECGVAAGNVAVASKEPLAERGIIGMDLVRLALERADCAYEGVRVVTEVIQRYPQSIYHNSFIIADPREAWVLETAGRYWAARRVRGADAISNTYTIEAEWDEAHPKLVKHALERGWCASEGDFSFARAYGDYSVPYMRKAHMRLRRSLELLRSARGELDVRHLMRAMRDHGEGTLTEPIWAGDEAVTETLCVHGSGETAASMVVELRDAGHALLRCVCWALLSSPCTSVYFPLLLGAEVPEELGRGSDRYEEGSPWWLFERLQRLVDKNYRALAPVVRGVWDYVEEVELAEVRVLRLRLGEMLSEGRVSEAAKAAGEYVRRSFDRVVALARELEAVVARLASALPERRSPRWEYVRAKSEEAGLRL